jgi:REP element-mobilizing transposase RayT
MSHSFTNLLYHLVFATKERQPWLGDALRPDLFDLLGGLVRRSRGLPLEINGMPDHVHLLVKLRPDVRLCDVVRALKARSSFWAHQAGPELEGFAWQTGYGGFSVSHSQVEVVRRYIRNQETHHRTVTFDDEMRKLVRLHGLEVEEQALWE